MTDPVDVRLRDYTDLTDVALRRAREPAEGLFMAESLAVIDRALAAGYRPRSVLTGERWLPQVARLLSGYGLADTAVMVATPDVIATTTGFRMPRGPMAAMARRPLPPAAEVLSGTRLVLVLGGLVDHTNVGAAFRSAAALGADAVLVTHDCADPLYRRAVRVSMGTVFSLPWTRTTDWVADLAGFRTLALTPAADAVPLAAVPSDAGRPTAVIVGTEGPGLSPQAQGGAGLRVRIPMRHDVDSLNVAAAVAVAVHMLAPHPDGGEVPTGGRLAEDGRESHG